MSENKFPKLIDYAALKQQFGEDEQSCSRTEQIYSETTSALHFASNSAPNINKQYPAYTDAIDDQEYIKDPDEQQSKRPGLTGSRLRSYAFAVLTRKEYSKNDLIEKLALYAENRDEVIELVNELARENYQSDQRLAEMLLASQKRQGKGPNRIKMALKNKKVDSSLISEELKETDWAEQAYQLKVKKFGTEVANEPKLKAKQIRFLQYRGFDMDAIMKAIRRKEQDF
ncbi:MULTISPECIES: regulatory protein RecX [Acinetobacter]|uniref:regulatory protein RecX n=1 Tax=Acinetobacter TaxID=469 RepID=UPI0015D2225B|nr:MULTISPECIES: regulatory protein RecX [Acinetobacter]MCO8053313.1 recombination regulator RecX [Acinetobacter towneri]MCO8056925.1 recombination regulator RecX [Acinetobacter towneri]